MNVQNEFETDRLLLRPTSAEDAEFILKLMNTPKWLKYIGDRQVRSVPEAEKYIKTKMQPQLDRLGFSNYTVIRKSDQKKMGTCGLYDREGLEGIDIGFAFLPEYEGMGYAYEASNLLKNLAFDKFELQSLSAITNFDNSSSQRLLEKLGMKNTGSIKLENQNQEILLYKISFD